MKTQTVLLGIISKFYEIVDSEESFRKYIPMIVIRLNEIPET